MCVRATVFDLQQPDPKPRSVLTNFLRGPDGYCRCHRQRQEGREQIAGDAHSVSWLDTASLCLEQDFVTYPASFMARQAALSKVPSPPGTSSPSSSRL